MTDHGGASASRIAIVGMAGRFPGAPNLEAFWRNLRQGIESIAFYSKDELRAMGVDAAWLNNPSFVPARPHVEGRELFDAGFFGYSAQEAEIIDPQQRLFLEVAWEALEDAGYEPDAANALIGIWCGSSQNTYLWFNLLVRPGFFERHGMLRTIITNGPDYLATRVAYKLNLRGPAVTVQTACSTSLVALHQACQALLNFECDMALAGGASLRVTPIVGYLYEAGGLLSRDGHCRAFDASASGTLFGDGVGVVVLKRLEDALADGDTIHAVVLGSAVNNDGSLKAGFTAPGLSGQAKVIFQALDAAGVAADTISYVEAHGTGTDLGDPIEVSALTKAFRATTDRRGFCAIGSVKTNIGHLDAAAGVAGLIKTVLALKHREIPATLHFRAPNQNIDFAASPFRVNATLAEWPSGDTPRRAGVSAFGIGGTNAHVVVEEAPAQSSSLSPRAEQVLVLSGRTELAVDRAAERLVEFFRAHPDTSLADAAYTLAVGRRVFSHRRTVVARSVADAIAQLERRSVAPLDAAPSAVAALCERWRAGGDVDWPAQWIGEPRRRISLPTYPFERQRYWSDPFGEESSALPSRRPSTTAAAERAVDDWFEVPIWRQSSALPSANRRVLRWLVIEDEAGFGAEVSARLAADGQTVTRVWHCEQWTEGVARIGLRCDNAGDLVTLFDRLRVSGRVPDRVVCCASVRARAATAGLDRDAFFVPLALVQALATVTTPVRLLVVTASAQTVIGGDGVLPDGALAVGVARVAGRELAHLSSRVVDLPIATDPAGRWPDLARAAIGELDIDDNAPLVAYRHGRRWVPAIEPLRLPAPADDRLPLREGGTYLVTGAFGGLGLAVASALARRGRPNLVLVGRRAPAPHTVSALEAAGAHVLVVTADVADEPAMRGAVAHARRAFGRIDGVVHAAGIAGGGLIALKTPTAAAAVLRPKVAGTRSLLSALGDDFPDFLVLFSSIAAMTGDVGQVDYAAANTWLDATAVALSASGRRVLSLDWDAWSEVGMAVTTGVSASLRDRRDEQVSRGISSDRGIDALFRALAQPRPHLIVSPAGVAVRLAEAEIGAALVAGGTTSAGPRHARPDLDTPFSAPATPTASRLAAIWEDLLGIDGVGVHDSFFDLGGDSLLATQLIARIRTAFGRECSLRDVMECSTIDALSAALDTPPPLAVAVSEEQLFAELAALSEEEAEARLRALDGPTPEAP